MKDELQKVTILKRIEKDVGGGTGDLILEGLRSPAGGSLAHSAGRVLTGDPVLQRRGPLGEGLPHSKKKPRALSHARIRA